MPSRRRFVQLSSTSALALLGGCATRSTPSNRTANTTAQETSTEQTIAQADLSDAEAKEQALQAEQEHLKRQLSSAGCLDRWGTGSSTARESASVTTRTTEGVRVEVTHPYSYTEIWTEAGSNKSNQVISHGGSHAKYLVTPEMTKRLSGDTLSLC